MPTEKELKRNEGFRKTKKGDFSKENQPANRGRKTSKIKELGKLHDLSAEDISKMLKDLLQRTELELSEISGDITHPLIYRSFARALLDDFGKASVYHNEIILNRAVGKPKEHIETDHIIQVSITDNK
ncbi:MAG TPA: hypothetical protein VLE21_00070 [Candidatus Nitrosocosmicus sp.]|nr:hypothetical protein [Candidatus Nitrosocosmicus sp.]